MYTDEEGYVHPWDLLKSNDPLRQEMAPFTGEYYQLLRDNYEIPDMIMGMCRYDEDVMLTEQEVEDGWTIQEIMEHYSAKVKSWQSVVNIGGEVRASGDLKRTYEVINDSGSISSYSLDRVPAYKMAMQGMREGTSSLMQYQADKRRAMQKAASVRDVFAAMEGDGRSIVDKYKEKKYKLEESKAHAKDWGLEVKTMKKEEKKKMTSKEKNAAATADDLYGGGDDEDDDEEEEDEDSEEEEEEEYKGGDDDDESDGSGLI